MAPLTAPAAPSNASPTDLFSSMLPRLFGVLLVGVPAAGALASLDAGAVASCASCSAVSSLAEMAAASAGAAGRPWGDSAVC